MAPERSDTQEGSRGGSFAGLRDEELVTASLDAAEGDQRAFGELIRRYEARVRANCRYLTNEGTDSDDLAQEVLVKAFFARRRFEGRASFRTWLWRIKANHCLNYIERRRVRSVVRPWSEQERDGSAIPSEDVRPDDAVVASEHVARVRKVIDGVQENLRVALILRDLDGLSYADLADALGIGLSAAKMRVARAREEFRAAYSALEADDQ